MIRNWYEDDYEYDIEHTWIEFIQLKDDTEWRTINKH